MDAVQAKIQLRNLREWRLAYYNAKAIVTDAIYDDVEDQCRAFSATLPAGDTLKLEIDEFLAGVGAAVDADETVPNDSHWVKAKHKAPMGSLNKAQNDADLKEWSKSCGINGLILWSDKCDGISIALYYEGGSLVQAVTRGDGEIGEDITRNVLRMKGIIKSVKGFDGFIRGEIVLMKDDHRLHFPTYANPRNAASGIAKRLDGVGCEHLTVLHYQMIRFGNAKPFPSKQAEYKVLQHFGAAVPSWGIVNSMADMTTVYAQYVDGLREGLNYEIDGLVIEFDDLVTMEGLGQKNNRPKGAIAYKFPHDQKVTILRNIRWQVGNTGRITPVAEFEPVKLAGATVMQASLHNLSNIQKLCSQVGQTTMFEGNTVIVSRRNDVIPYCESIVKSDLPAGAKAFHTPDKCPVCATAVKMEGEYLLCPNTETCPAQVSGAVKAWVTKIGLKGWGETIIDTLCEQGIINSPADLYKLDAGELADVQMEGRRVGGTADIILTELHAKKDMPLHVLVGSLNIPLCSRSTCKTLVDAGFDTLDKMRAAKMVEVAAVPSMGVGRAEAFVRGLLTRKELIDALLAAGITVAKPSDGPLKGKSFCMTGFRDSDMQAAIEAAGGTIKSGVSKDLTTLIAKDWKSNSGKAQKAQQYGVEVIGIDEMWDRLGGQP